jgi:hypothetical protein
MSSLQECCRLASVALNTSIKPVCYLVRPLTIMNNLIVLYWCFLRNDNKFRGKRTKIKKQSNKNYFSLFSNYNNNNNRIQSLNFVLL